ncbi:hypothetical protein GQF42_41690 [Streptomyces broussonetiae]|uniref:Pyrroline-5-carboxylate reductase catalytic N-terminal domain-containing protein n=1 Tax=Streptomyces broussonetiae TaxID=2686304 RepID=A0A6I6NFI2_9ACTN|nr:NAD(P)-binding domain-containing protein [Streptomyces broussonetiae]QHA08900.1 hypothetical protein GQF42_41690 [Streptomyces broussonetiae]
MTTHSSIGVLGAGEVGRAVADKAVRHGHEVVIGNSRGPETPHTLVGELGPWPTPGRPRKRRNRSSCSSRSRSSPSRT